MDRNELEVAEIYLNNAAQNDFTTFIKLLSDVLVQEGNSDVAKMAAGLHLKNLLTSKDPMLKQQCQERWLALPEDIKFYIKNNILTTLGKENYRPSSAAQCIVCVAIIELPVGQWDELIPILAENVIGQATELTKEATLEVLRYICKDVDAEVLKESINQILTATIQGMRSTEPSNYVRLTATKALLNVLELCKANFENENERNCIMEVVCEATQSTNISIIVAALQCLVKIVSLYYEYMECYMNEALFTITLDAIKSDIDEISLEGIDFWTNVIKIEIQLGIEEAEAAKTGRPAVRTSRFYARRVLHSLAPTLTQKLNKDCDTTDDELDWNPPRAVAMCLMLLLTCYEDETVDLVSPFIDSKIKDINWRYREAALMAYDNVLDGVNPDMLKFFL